MHSDQLEIPSQFGTERLILRCYQPGDGPMYYAVGQRNREHLARYETGNVVLSARNEQEAEDIIAELTDDYESESCFFLGAFERETGEFVAQIYIGPVHWNVPEFEIGFFVDIDHEGQGYVTEAARAALYFAFVYLKAHRVRLECDDTNERSRRVAERLGMIQEGHIRENRRNPDGGLTGTYHYGMLKEEFEALRGKH